MTKNRKIKDINSNKNQSYIKKFYAGLEVVEAKNDLHIQPSEADIQTAIPNDPKNCIFSRACQRMWGAKSVVFFGTVAYVDLLCSDGKRRVHRFVLDKDAREYVREFDVGNPLDPRGFTLHKPPASGTVAAKSKQQKKRRKRKALLKGETIIKMGAPRPVKKPRTMRISAFRNGTGMAQFPQVEVHEPRLSQA